MGKICEADLFYDWEEDIYQIVLENGGNSVDSANELEKLLSEEYKNSELDWEKIARNMVEKAKGIHSLTLGRSD